MGQISDKNTRTLITIPKELKKILEGIAKEDNRSFNNLVITILSNYVETRNEK
jgi:predicted HicB family RNase H-like nuclease